MSTTPTSPGAARLAYVDHGSGRTPAVPDFSDVMTNLRKVPSSHLGNSFTLSGGGGGAHHIALPSSPCLTTAPPSEVHTSTLLPPSKSTTSNKNLTTTEILYNSRPKPLSPHPQLTYVTTTPRSSLELQGCDHNDTSLLTAASGGATTSDIETNSNTAVRQSLDPIVSLTSFASQQKNHTNLLPCLDSSTNNSSSESHNHGCQPSVDEDLLLVATSLAGMKRRRPGTRNT